MCRLIEWDEQVWERTLPDGRRAFLSYEVPETQADKMMYQRILRLRRKLPWETLDAIFELRAEISAEFSRRQDMGLGEPPDHWRIPEPAPTDQVMRMRKLWYKNLNSCWSEDPQCTENMLAAEQRVLEGLPPDPAKIDAWGHKQRLKTSWQEQVAQHLDDPIMHCDVCEHEFSARSTLCPKCGNNDSANLSIAKVEGVTNGWCMAVSIMKAHGTLGAHTEVE